MLKKRLIPVLFLKNGLIVRSQGFVDFRELGNPLNQLDRLNDWGADELIYVDITRDGEHDTKRDDHKIKLGHDTLDILRAISKRIFMPLTFGGRIRKFEEAAGFIQNGADKIIVNTGAYRDPGLITRLSRHFGAQCVVAGMDVIYADGSHKLVIDQGLERVSDDPVEYACKLEALGAGEIFLNSIDRDGAASGYDIDIIQKISSSVSIPVIACGGAGSFDDFDELFEKTSASAAGAGNIFNFTENAYPRAKKHLITLGRTVRQ